MKPVIILLFMNLLLPSCAHVKNDDIGNISGLPRLLATDNSYAGSSIEEAMHRALCGMGAVVSSKATWIGFLDQSGENEDKESNKYSETKSGVHLSHDDVSISSVCLMTRVDMCKDGSASCADNEKISMIKIDSTLTRNAMGFESVNSYTSEIIRDTNGEKLKDIDMLKMYSESNGRSHACDISCLLKDLYKVGIGFGDITVGEDESQEISLALSVNIERLELATIKYDLESIASREELDQAIRGSMQYDRALWQQFKAPKDQDKLAAAITEMDDEGRKTVQNNKTISNDAEDLWKQFKAQKGQDELSAAIADLSTDPIKTPSAATEELIKNPYFIQFLTISNGEMTVTPLIKGDAGFDRALTKYQQGMAELKSSIQEIDKISSD